MKILTSKYWGNFKKTVTYKNGTRKIVKDGLKFEQLVKKILDLEYGENHWKETGITNDGSRDFEWRTAHSFKWAECKNYESKISLNVLSNTLVMAMIDFADEILIFSYSKIKKPVLEKLIRFADISQKVLRIYEDDSLEEIILSYIENLHEDFFPSFDINTISEHNIAPYVNCNILVDPVTAYTMNVDFSNIPKSPKEINHNSILCINIIMHNRLSKETQIKIKINWDKCNFRYEILNAKYQDTYNIFLGSHMTSIEKVFFRPLAYKKVLKMPKVVITSSNSEKEFNFRNVKCSWIGECALQGSTYITIIDEFSSRVLIPPYFSGMHIYGTSGVGKSRILTECENIAMGYGYRIIRLNIDVKSDSENYVFQIMREFVCSVFDVPDLEDYLENLEEKEVCGIYQILVNLKNNFFDESYIEKTIIPQIIKKLLNSKCYISLDNVQFYPEAFVKFLNNIIKILLLSNHHCQSRFGLVFNTDYIQHQTECMELFSMLSNSNYHILNRKLDGFKNQGEATIFLNQLLANANIDDSYISKILSASSNNPFLIVSFLKYLEIQGILFRNEDFYTIPPCRHKEFIEVVEELNISAKEILDKRWEYYLYTHSEEESVKIFSIMHIFQKIDHNLISTFLLSPNDINELCKHHFLLEKSTNQVFYIFEHDLTEKFFSKKYFPLCKMIFLKAETVLSISYPLYQNLRRIISNDQLGYDEIKKIFEKDIPYKIGYEFFSLLLEYILKHMHSLVELKTYLGICFEICSSSREKYGTEAALILYDNFVETIINRFPDFQSNINWAWGMVSYNNVLYEYGKYERAIANMKNLLKYWKECDLKEDNAIIYGYIYNRLHVYSRALNTNILTTTLEWLKKSEEIQSQMKNSELKFLNLIDRGYCQYSTVDNKVKLVKYWSEACELYEKEKLISKKMNFFYHKAQLHLFNHELDSALKVVDDGFHTIEFKEDGLYYETYFKERYYLCQIVCLLIPSKTENYTLLIELIQQAEKHNYILKSRSDYTISYLKSIFYFRQKKYQDSFECIQAAKQYLINNKKMTFKNVYLKQLYNNVKYFLVKGMEDSLFMFEKERITDHKILSVINETIHMGLAEKEEFLINYKADSIIQSEDGKINFPSL